MTEEEFKSYRFSSGEDPTDEMLDQLMTNAANRVRKENEEANKRFFENLHRECEAVVKREEKRKMKEKKILSIINREKDNLEFCIGDLLLESYQIDYIGPQSASSISLCCEDSLRDEIVQTLRNLHLKTTLENSSIKIDSNTENKLRKQFGDLTGVCADLKYVHTQKVTFVLPGIDVWKFMCSHLVLR